MESQYFIFDDIQSTEMNLYIVKIEQTGFIQTPYWGGTDIKEERISNRLNPYFYGVEREPIEFTVQFLLADENMNPMKWTSEQRYKIGRWLVHDTYKSFQTSDDLGKYYFAICTNPIELNLINTEGYIEVTFRTNSCYAWSPLYIDEYDLSMNETSQIIVLENRSNVIKKYKPKIEIQMMGDSDVTLKNLSNGGVEFNFTGLRTDEIVSVDNENELVLSNYPININPFGNFNKQWLELVYGQNQIQVVGKCKIWVKSRFMIAQ